MTVKYINDAGAIASLPNATNFQIVGGKFVAEAGATTVIQNVSRLVSILDGI